MSPYILLSFVCGLIGFIFAGIAFFVYLSYIEIKTMKDFREFTGCLIDDGVEIILTTNKDTSWCEWFRRLKHESGAWLVEAQLTYFQIKCHRVKEDLGYVKLYCKGPASVLYLSSLCDSVEPVLVQLRKIECLSAFQGN